jgi:hypothetical protein
MFGSASVDRDDQLAAPAQQFVETEIFDMSAIGEIHGFTFLG